MLGSIGNLNDDVAQKQNSPQRVWSEKKQFKGIFLL
jgi:hypothetical protein